MKKYIYTLAFSGLFLLSSCFDNNFIDADSNRLTINEALNHQTSAEDMLYATYNIFTMYNFMSQSWIYASTIPSDNAQAGRFEVDVDANVFDQIGSIGAANTPALNATWKAHYLGIRRANEALERIPNLGHLNEEKIIAEVRFLRALMYFRLSQLFGGVPLVTKVLDPKSVDDTVLGNTKRTRKEVYEFILDELEAIKEILPRTTDYTPEQQGRVSKGAVLGLLAKVYMYAASYQGDGHPVQIEGEINGNTAAENWSLCNARADEVKALGYTLDEDYKQLGGTYDPIGGRGDEGPFIIPTVAWHVRAENNVESIFEVQGNKGIETTANLNGAVASYSNLAGQANVQATAMPLEALVKEYDDAGEGDNVYDRRLYSTFYAKESVADSLRVFDKDRGFIDEEFSYDYASSKGYVATINQTEPGGFRGANGNKNIRILRYAEILLIKAEAANELDKTAEALAALNEVIARSYGNEDQNVSGLTQEEIRDRVWKERRLELAFEHDRWFDLGRQGRRKSVINASLKERDLGETYDDTKHEVYPIPYDQIQASKHPVTGEILLEQNPGY